MQDVPVGANSGAPQGRVNSFELPLAALVAGGMSTYKRGAGPGGRTG